MAIYVQPLTIPRNTPKAQPVEVEIKVEQEVITKFELHFPPGCAGMVHARVLYGIKQIWPWNKPETFTGDGETLSFPEYWECPEIPCKLIFQGWSPGTQHPHTLILRLSASPRAVAAPILELRRVIQALAELLGV